MNGPAFAAYVRDVLELQPGTVVVLDNLATHRNAEAAAALRDVGCWFFAPAAIFTRSEPHRTGIFEAEAAST